MVSRRLGRTVLQAADRMLADLRNAPGGARPVSELAAAAVAGRGVADDDVEPALGYLADTGRIVLTAHPAPDPHLDGIDLRIAAVTDGPAPADIERARQRADARWHRLVRDFVASHRCG